MKKDPNSPLPSPFKNHFRDHKECEWHLIPGEKTRIYQGNTYAVVNFSDVTCSFIESVPVTPDDYLAISDSLRKAMGWAKDRFHFGGAWFYRMRNEENAPFIGAYMPAFLHAAGSFLTGTG